MSCYNPKLVSWLLHAQGLSAYGGGGLEAGAVGEKFTALWGHSEEGQVHPGPGKKAESTTALQLRWGGA